ncbi:hypothetical protein L1987_45108 [Smallanthus sonchifolius]|uniref:Uncharacterized protein n=1 Tax=Smallanthus sonchifolius TaxID=185202 RepID=A0ACB9GTG2_9ASTR|nr:hypothetical protein L1987_45108 [Smallanthus sonchifolius]
MAECRCCSGSSYRSPDTPYETQHPSALLPSKSIEDILLLFPQRQQAKQSFESRVTSYPPAFLFSPIAYADDDLKKPWYRYLLVHDNYTINFFLCRKAWFNRKRKEKKYFQFLPEQDRYLFSPLISSIPTLQH